MDDDITSKGDIRDDIITINRKLERLRLTTNNKLDIIFQRLEELNELIKKK